MNRYVPKTLDDIIVIDGREFTVKQLRISIKSHEMTKKVKRESAKRRRKAQNKSDTILPNQHGKIGVHQ